MAKKNAERKTRQYKKDAPKQAPRKHSAAQPATSKSAGVTKDAVELHAGPRRVKLPLRLPNVWQLTKASARLLWQHKGLLVCITLVYGLLNLVLVQGLANSTDTTSLKQQFDQVFHGQLGALASGFSIFVLMVGSAGNSSSQTAGAYQLFLVLIASLAVIWALRQVLAGTAIRTKDAYYRGMYPLIPFVLVLLVVGLQLLPLLLGASLYNLVVGNGIAVHAAEKVGWGLGCILLAIWSLYMISSSLFALYIVTLPDMTPLKALRSARQLVRGRRWTVLRKVLFLPVLLLIVAAVVMLPIILWLTPLAQWVFFLLTMLSLTAIHTYMYTLYRELLRE